MIIIASGNRCARTVSDESVTFRWLLTGPKQTFCVTIVAKADQGSEIRCVNHKISENRISTRQHPRGGGREALSNPFWGFFLSSTYNMSIIGSDCVNWRIWWDPKNGPKMGPSSRVFQLLNPFQAVHFLDICWFGRTPARGGGGARRTLAPGGPEERNRRFAQKCVTLRVFTLRS